MTAVRIRDFGKWEGNEGRKYKIKLMAKLVPKAHSLNVHFAGIGWNFYQIEECTEGRREGKKAESNWGETPELEVCYRCQG